MKNYLYLLLCGLTGFIHTSDSSSTNSDIIETPKSSVTILCETKTYTDAKNLLGNPEKLQAYLEQLQTTSAWVQTLDDAQLHVAKELKESLGATLVQTMPHNEISQPIIYKVYKLYAIKNNK